MNVFRAYISLCYYHNLGNLTLEACGVGAHYSINEEKDNGC